MRRREMIGKTFNKLTVKQFSSVTTRGMSKYLCVCQCGKEVEVSHANLNTGHTGSCGCLRTGNPSHGMRHTKEYRAWLKMRERCHNPNDTSYPGYGGKGVVVADIYRESFQVFFEEVGKSPSNKHSIDRIDHTKGYVPGNLRWATDTQQARNKGMNRNNSSGENGVNFYYSGNPNHTTFAVAQWKNLDGEGCNKKFSIRKHGLIPAFAMAVIYRRNQIALLNQQGAEYAPNHGHQKINIKGEV